jgi:hypothetical protein
MPESVGKMKVKANEGLSEEISLVTKDIVNKIKAITEAKIRHLMVEHKLSNDDIEAVLWCRNWPVGILLNTGKAVAWDGTELRVNIPPPEPHVQEI